MSTVEKFSTLSMDPESNGFIARKIGTSDGEFPLKSKYVMVELADNFPTNGFPAGFEGVLQRGYIGSGALPEGRAALPPQIEYKTEYGALNTSKLSKTYLRVKYSNRC